jgi:hypothetical protein
MTDEQIIPSAHKGRAVLQSVHREDDIFDGWKNTVVANVGIKFCAGAPHQNRKREYCNVNSVEPDRFAGWANAFCDVTRDRMRPKTI